MGHTVYWIIEKTASQVQYNKALTLIRKIIKDNKNILAGYDGNGTPQIKDGVSFNGKGENSHETFALNKDISQGAYDFCKTARKPYDGIVKQCLVVLKRFLGDKISVRVDGAAEDFQEAVDIMNKKYMTPSKKTTLKKDLAIPEFKNPIGG